MNPRYTPLQLVRFWLDTPRRILQGVELAEGVEDPLGWLVDVAPSSVHDVRAKPGERFGKRAIPRGSRRWGQIEGVTFHQTAVGPGHMGPASIRKCPAHSLVDHRAHIWLLWDPRVLLWHANALNDESIGIEIDCRAAGVEGDESTVWLSKRERNGYHDRRGRWHRPVSADEVVREATDDQLEAGRVVAIYYALMLRRNWNQTHSLDQERRVKVWAHRQGHRSRVTDPGSRIYSNTCMPLIDRDEFIAGEEQGSGSPIPDRWRQVT
jgi:hypothetical protein